MQERSCSRQREVSRAGVAGATHAREHQSQPDGHSASIPSTGQIQGQFNQERLIARLTLMFGVLALVLASVGLYGVTAYSVARRTPEIGVRMALGANRGSVVTMVLREAMMQAAIGLAIGIPVAWLCARFVQSQLYNVGGHDAGVLAGAVAVLAIAACTAGLIPAQRAASTDPVKALRSE